MEITTTEYDTMITLIRASRKLLEEAENINSQPLYYDKDGNYVDIVKFLRYIEREIKDIKRSDFDSFFGKR